MAKHPPEIYSPGELDKVRKNIGTISPEEARRMATVLGGQVGVEKTPEVVRKKNPSTNILNRSERKVRSTGSASPSPAKTEPEEFSPGSLKITFRDRLKKNFLASRKENRIQSLSQSILSIFSFVVPVPDTIHPEFILQSNKLFLEPVENFVYTVRKIVSPKKEELQRKLIVNPFYGKVLQTLCAWDIETLHRELSRIRLQPERVRFSQFEQIVCLLYRPYLQLYRLSPDVHIRKAIEFALLHHLPLVPVESRAGLQKAGDTAVSLLPEVFENIRKRCFPLMLKTIPVACYEYEEFFRTPPEGALYHFSITPGDILRPEDALTVTGPVRPVTAPAEEPVEEPAASGGTSEPEILEPVLDLPAGSNEKIIRIPPEARKGMEHLDTLFPGFGLAGMENRPDLYPLIQKEFHSISGIDLVPKNDPLLQIIFLHGVLGELFYGFRSIDFSSFSGSGSNQGMIEDLLDPVFDTWPYFIDEILEKQYFPRLLEIQRQTERTSEFLGTDYGRKLQADLRWFRRLYLLPYQEIESAVGIRRASRNQDAPVLSVTLSTLRSVFAEVTEDLEKTVKTLRSQGMSIAPGFSSQTIHNPWDRYSFEIENPVSKRLSRLLVKKVQAPDGSFKVKDQRYNANLVFFTASIVFLFDYLVNSESSYFYQDQPLWLFRRSSEEQTPGDTGNR